MSLTTEELERALASDDFDAAKAEVEDERRERESIRAADAPSVAEGVASIIDAVSAPSNALPKRPRREPPPSKRRLRAVDDRPTIHVTAGGLGDVFRAAMAALPSHPGLYQRGNQLVRVVSDIKPSKREEAAFVAGQPRLIAEDLASLRVTFADIATWTKFDSRSNKVIETRPDSDAIAAVHVAGEWPGVRPIVGIAEAPFPRSDGSIFDTPGYDARTGYLLQTSTSYGRIADRPTQADARAAFELLLDPFLEFPWSGSPRLGAAVCAAAAATIVCRAAIEGPCPAFLIDKNTPGTGGSLCTDAIAIMATGRISPRLSWPPDRAELAKTLDAAAIGGARLCNFDNVSPAVPFEGAALDKMITAEEVEIRILGKTKVLRAVWLAVFLASGNNILVTGDTVRRVLVARMETAVERPQDREGFRIPDLRAHVREHHARYVRAILTLIRAYFVAGCPNPVKPWGSFEAWAALIASAIRWSSGINILDARLEEEKSGDPQLSAHVVVMKQLGRFVPEKDGVKADGISLRDLLGRLYDNGRIPTGFEEEDDAAIRGALETLAPPRVPGRAPDAHALGNAMRRFRGVVRDRQRLVTRPDRNKVLVWGVEKVS